MKIASLPALALLALGPLHQAPAPPPAPIPVTAILLRHAETAQSTLEVRDPQLSERGLERAQALARLLSTSSPTHLFCSEYARTQATLQPLALAAELTPTTIDAGDAASLRAALLELPAGAVAVVCGHSNTIPALARSLGAQRLQFKQQGGRGPALEHSEYGRLFILTLPPQEGAGTAAIELHYEP